MMHIACFYTRTVQANCLEALRRYAPDTEYVHVDKDDSESYAREIAKRWDGSDDLVIIEHDNEITAEVIPSFAACDQPWCSYQYEIFSPPYTRLCDTGFGCTRFSKELQQKISFRDRVLELPCEVCGSPHAYWGELDMRLCTQISDALNIGVHVHGQINHYHPYQAIEPDENGEYPEPGGVDSFEGGFRHVRR